MRTFAWKINVLSLLGSHPVIEEGIDNVPAEFITALTTEDGLTRPMKISKYANSARLADGGYRQFRGGFN